MFLIQLLLFVVSFVLSSIIMDNITQMAEKSPKNKSIIVGDYIPLGKIINIGDLPIYEYDPTGNVNRKRMLIGIYDIYGLTEYYPNIMQVIDQMAQQNGGFRAIIPDFFRGGSWDPNLDPKLRQPWLKRVGDWNSVVKPDIFTIVDHYGLYGVEEFAIFGISWGGKVATLAAKELSDVIKASAVIHPTSVKSDDVEDVKIPLYLMPSRNEPDMLPFYQALRNKFGDNSGHRRFDDMKRGFSGALSNFSDPLIQQRVSEVITILGAFFDQNLKKTKQDGINSPNIHQDGHS